MFTDGIKAGSYMFVWASAFMYWIDDYDGDGRIGRPLQSISYDELVAFPFCAAVSIIMLWIGIVISRDHARDR